MFKNKRGIGFILGFLITLVLVFSTIKIVSDIAKYKIDEEEKESFLKLVDSINELDPGERNFEFLKLGREGISILGFTEGSDPIIYKNEIQKGLIIRPEACKGVACLCYCGYLEPQNKEWKAYDRDNPVDLRCIKSICKSLSVNIPELYNQDNFKIIGAEGDFEFKNGFVILKKMEKERKTELGKYDVVNPTPLNPSGTSSPIGVELHFERGKDKIHFCFETQCIK